MSSSWLNWSTSAAGFLLLVASVAQASVATQGSAESIRIEVQNASLEEVLGALHAGYGLSYSSKVPLEREVSGTYEGSLARVVGLLLKDMNFVLAHQGQTLHVTITSAAGRQGTIVATPVPAAAPAAPVAASKQDAAAAKAASDVLKLMFPPVPPPPTPSAREQK